MDHVERELGPIALVVNNAGMDRPFGPLWEADPELWWGDVEGTCGGHSSSPALSCRRCSRAAPGVSSTLRRTRACVRSPYNSVYGAAEAAIINLTASLAESLKGTGVHAFAISAGHVLTAMTTRLLELQEERGWFPHLVGRDPLDPSLASRLVLQLASAKADRLSGRYLHALDDLDDLLATG